MPGLAGLGAEIAGLKLCLVGVPWSGHALEALGLDVRPHKKELTSLVHPPSS